MENCCTWHPDDVVDPESSCSPSPGISARQISSSFWILSATLNGDLPWTHLCSDSGNMHRARTRSLDCAEEKEEPKAWFRTGPQLRR